MARGPRVEVSWNGDNIVQGTDAATARGLLKAAEYLLGESSAIVPIDEGVLDQSGVASVDRAELVAAVSFDTPYAVEQHENLHYRHAPGRQAKYLEEPWIREAPTMGRIVATEIQQEFR